MMAAIQQKTVGIVLFPEVEVLDFCGPFEVFSVTRLNESKRREEPSPFRVLLIADTAEPVSAAGGMRVLPDCTTTACPALDILLVPGGWGTRVQMTNTRLIDWIRQRARKVETLTSVCTGSLLLGQAGLLDGRRATTHWAALSLLRERFPKINVVDDQHVVEEENILTSAGISAGIDLALRIVARYFGEPVARNAARHMEYPYPESNARRVQVGA
jgi:transcriptional regulator GlxA family with amidase domain